MTSPTPPVPAPSGDSSAPRLVVGVALLDDAASPTFLLTARRSAPASLRGLWEFPGGKVEPGEGPREALLREVAEELGARVRLGVEVAAPDEDGWPLANGARMRVFYGVLEDGSAEPEPLEDHDLLVWTPLEAEMLHSHDWIPADRPIVDAVLAQLPGAFAAEG